MVFLTAYCGPPRNIPLVPGSIYAPSGKQLFLIVPAPKVPRVFSHDDFRAVVRLLEPGVVVYKFCYTVRLRIQVPQISPQTVLLMMVFMAALSLFIMLGGPVVALA
jgi:hypothetical protein